MVMGLLRLFQDFRMVSVHEDFIVIAIGMACSEEYNSHRATSQIVAGMPSRGNPLDPPLLGNSAQNTNYKHLQTSTNNIKP